MGARVYDPYTGTFTQPDPLQGGGATPYGYTDGDPVNETDLTGDTSAGTLVGQFVGAETAEQPAIAFCGPLAAVCEVGAAIGTGVVIGVEAGAGGKSGAPAPWVPASHPRNTSPVPSSSTPISRQYRTELSGKRRAARPGSTDVPSWVKNGGYTPQPGESGKDFANRALNDRYGEGNWQGTGPGSEHSQIKKYGDRHFGGS